HTLKGRRLVFDN
nr:Chain E, CELL DIVISION CONTROL PROTEIN 6 HOMOLOG [Homo sapiens]2CCH_F Chain F, CELL DIVISION CONTROL PROTEIN 6 HOMOLOG [Homo sapiens]